MATSPLPSGPLADILAKLDDVKATGGGWAALCPAHDDSTRSLSLKEGRDGRALVKCHAGCTFEQIVAAMGLPPGALFRDPKPTERPAAGPKLNRPRLVATYDYTDEHGTLLFQACRFEPKDFRQRRPDGNGNWIWSLGEVTPVLYRLPEIIEAIAMERPVYLVEGEKDADALAEMGYAATTSPMGAGKWKEEYARTLAGASVVILPDNDEPGRAHAETAAASLVAAGCTVRVVELPGVPPKGDFSDWLAVESNSLDDLESLIGKTRIWKPSGANRSLWRLDELLADDEVMRPPLPIVPRLAWEARSTLLAAAEKSGKSTLTGAMAAAVSRGTLFLDEPCQLGTVLLIGLEEFIGDAARRLRHFDADPSRVFILDRLPTDPRERPSAIRAAIATTAPRLVIIDSLIAYSSGEVTDASSSAQMGPIVQEITRMAHETQVSVVLIHHARKTDGKYRDSSAIGGGVDVIAEVYVPEPDADPTLRKARVVGRVPAHGFAFRYDGNVYRLSEGKEAPLDDRIIDIARGRPGISKSDVAEAVGGRRTETLNAVARLLAIGKLVNIGSDTHGKLCVPGEKPQMLGSLNGNRLGTDPEPVWNR